MYKIGEFSTINKISKRMLRYYDEKGLLEPKRDEETGYRYYTDHDIECINKIKVLRKYDFSVEEIKEIFKMDFDHLKIVYKNKIESLKKKTTGYLEIIEEIKNHIEMESNLKSVNSYDVYAGTKKSFSGLCIRRIVSEDELDLLIDGLNERTTPTRFRFVGKYFAIFHEIKEEVSDLFDVEICQPILGKIDPIGCAINSFCEADYISTIHVGDYDSISYAYSALYNWANANGYSLVGPYIEKYYTDAYITMNQNEFVTEISISVKKGWP